MKWTIVLLLVAALVLWEHHKTPTNPRCSDAGVSDQTYPRATLQLRDQGVDEACPEGMAVLDYRCQVPE